MARVTYGALVTELKGSIGGTTFQTNKYGFSAKNKSFPGSFQSPGRLKMRQALNHVVQLWSTLTDAQRTQWSTFATTFPQPTKHNSSAMLSGYALFVKFNTLRYAGDGSTALVPSFTLPTLPTFTPTAFISGGDLNINLSASPVTLALAVNPSLSAAVKATTNFIGTRTRLMYLTIADASPINLEPDYRNAFGVDPVSGDFIFIRLQLFGYDCPYFFAPQLFKVQVA
jgi:hypothetical protein